MSAMGDAGMPVARQARKKRGFPQILGTAFLAALHLKDLAELSKV
jgi:hypothetical protein